jgi:hypothetical protein
MYLPDLEAIEFLINSKNHLTAMNVAEEDGHITSGLIFVKENISPQKVGFVLDREPNYITRTHEHYLALFQSAGLELIGHSYSNNWPTFLFPLGQYVLRTQLQ